MDLTLFLLADYVSQQFSGVFSCSTQKLVHAWSFFFTGARTPRWLASSEASLFSRKWDGLCVWKAVGAGMRGVFRRCVVTGLRRRNGLYVPAERWASTEEGRRVPSTGGSSEMNFSSERLGLLSWRCKQTAFRLDWSPGPRESTE